MAPESRVQRIRDAVTDSKALSESKKAGKNALKVMGDACGFTHFLAASAVSPLTSRIRAKFREYKAHVKET